MAEIISRVELQEAIDKLKASGVTVEAEVDLLWKRAFYLRDPDGLLSEYYVRRAADIDLAKRGDVPLDFAV